MGNPAHLLIRWSRSPPTPTAPGTGQQNTVYAYNARGLQSTITCEETGDVIMAYDAAGNMTRRIDEEGVTVDYACDALGRLVNLNALCRGTFPSPP